MSIRLVLPMKPDNEKSTEVASIAKTAGTVESKESVVVKDDE